MKLLISTFAHFLLWDDGDIRVIRRGHNETGKKGEFTYFGITWDESRIYIAEGCSEYPSRVHVYDGELEHRGTLPFTTLDAPHQLFWYDGTLYVANAGCNRIETWDGVRVWGIKWKPSTDDTEHINSIWCDGKHFYVVEHRWDAQPKRIQVFNRQWRHVQTIKRIHKTTPPGLHNVYVEDGMLYTLAPDVIMRVGLESGAWEYFPHGFDGGKRVGYMRGLARIDGRFIVGVSEIRPGRKGRAVGNSAFLVLDDNLQLLETVVLPRTGGITDIRAMHGDRAHNGVRCPIE